MEEDIYMEGKYITMKIKLILKESMDPESLFEDNLLWIRYLMPEDFKDRFKKNLGGLNFNNAKILSQVEIDKNKKVMKGAFGAVFYLTNGMMIKFFINGFDVQKDIARIKKSVDDVFAGNASLDDMHYFDYGEIGDKNHPLYFAIMPRIVPFMDSRDYQEDPQLFRFLSRECIYSLYNSRDAVDAAKRNNFDKFVHIFSEIVIDAIDQIKKTEPEHNILQGDDIAARIAKVGTVVRRILYAAMIAIAKHEGKDLHIGNLGYFPQKPDRFFYFDM